MRKTSECDRDKRALALWIVFVKRSPKVKRFIKLVPKISTVSHNSQFSIEMYGSHPHFSWHDFFVTPEVSVVLPEYRSKTSAKTTTTGPSAQEGQSPVLVTTVICSFWNENRLDVPMLVSKARTPGESGIWGCLDQDMATVASYWQVLPACLWKNIQRFT